MRLLILFTVLLVTGCATSHAGDEFLIHAFSKAAVWPVKDTQSDGGGK